MVFNIRILIMALFLIGLTPLCAQNQRLTWVGDEYAMRYEVIIEQEEEGEYNRVLQKFTEDFFIEVSLSSGKYRYQVIPYDFLNKPIPVTEWMNFEVRSGNATLAEGEHEIIMVNPGDETTNQEEIPLTAPEPEKIIEYKNQFDIYLSAAWVSLLPIYDEGKDKFEKSAYLGENNALSPSGVAVRLGIVPAQRRVFNPGIELAAAWRLYTTGSGENAQALLFDCNMIQQYRLTDDRAALNLRLGIGVSLVSSDDLQWAAGQQYSTHITIGASFLCFILQNVSMEIGMEYSQLFTKGFSCFIRPWIGLGYRF